MNLIVRVEGRGIATPLYIVDHLLQHIGTGEQEVSEILGHLRRSTPDQLEDILHCMAEAFHVGKAHGCRCPFQGMDRPENLVNCILVRSLLKDEEVLNHVLVVFPGLRNKEPAIRLKFRHWQPPSGVPAVLSRERVLQAAAPYRQHFSGLQIAPYHTPGSLFHHKEDWFPPPP
ncbi:MAG: hypothetical protein A4E42_01369 [Methanoregulaceae archaeon PtaU1.Bin222]|nr:MAG: hypothetical protein A4E42_01369 [Methanoregulaceae archaeon PtaU1.Bin222]